MVMVSLETRRLVLRSWREEDIEPFIAMGQDKNVMACFPGLLSRQQTLALVKRIQQHFSCYGYGLWAVERKDTKKFIGFAGLSHPSFDASFTPALEIGWRLASDQWGQGFAPELSQAILRFAFDELHLDEVVSFTARINIKSRRVMEKIGMSYDSSDDFDHPKVEEGHPLRPHVLYRLRNKDFLVKEREMQN